jgi:hypothetical protein
MPVPNRRTEKENTMRISCALTAAIAGLAVSSASAGVASTPISASILVAEGDVIDGSAITNLNSPFTNGLGQVGQLVNLADDRRAVLVDGSPIFLSSDALPDALTGGEGTMGIGNSGEFIYSPSFNGDDSVWGEGGLIAVENTPSPTGPAGFNTTFHSRPRMLDDGSSFWVSGLNDGAGGTSSLTRIVFFRDGATGAISAPIQAGDAIDGAIVAGGSGVDFDLSWSDDGAHNVWIFNDALTGSTADDTCIAIDGMIVAKEATPTGQGDNWDNFDNNDISTSGDYLFSGDTDGSTSTDEFIAYNGTIVLRENDAVLGGFVDGSVDEVSISNDGAAAFVWEFDDGSGLAETLFYATDASDLVNTLMVVCRVGDTLDTDDDGIADLTITDFNAGLGSGIDLAEDGLIHVELDVDNIVAANFEVIATFDMNAGGPCNDADNAEPFGVLDLADVNGFVNGYVNQLPAADIAAPFGVWDLSDVNAFIAAFNAGCP